jgi:hypothetical protein
MQQLPLPFHLNRLPTLESRPTSRHMSEKMDVDSEESHETQSHSSRSQFSSPNSRNGESISLSGLGKLEDPFKFERDHSRERKPGGRSESLIAMRLKDLAVLSRQRDGEEDGL